MMSSTKPCPRCRRETPRLLTMLFPAGTGGKRRMSAAPADRPGRRSTATSSAAPSTTAETTDPKTVLVEVPASHGADCPLATPKIESPKISASAATADSSKRPKSEAGCLASLRRGRLRWLPRSRRPQRVPGRRHGGAGMVRSRDSGRPLRRGVRSDAPNRRRTAASNVRSMHPGELPLQRPDVFARASPLLGERRRRIVGWPAGCIGDLRFARVW